MHLRRSITSLFIVCCLTKLALTQDNTTITSDGFLLELFKSSIIHAAAEASCNVTGGWLVRIKDENMRKSVSELKSGIGYSDPYDDYFIGLKCNGTKWVWNDGTELTTGQANWYKKEGYDSDQDCVGVFNIDSRNDKWFDTTCGERRRYICQSKPLTIVAGTNEIISVEGETVTVHLTITRRKSGEIDIKVYKDSYLVGNLPSVADDLTYTLENINETDAGLYRFAATPQKGSYTINEEVNIIVHVPVAITSMLPVTIFSPVTVGPSFVNCTTHGVPTPEANWQKNGSNVTTKRGRSVHQDKTEDGESVLFIDAALLFDQGKFTCQGINYVGLEKKEKTTKIDISLSVYGAPTIVEQSVEECSVDGKVIITWKPNNQTIGVNHSITLLQTDSSNDVVSKEMISNSEQTTTFDNLKSYTNYTIAITVCPDECIYKLNSSELTRTGVGLPNPVSVASVQISNKYCVIEWMWSDNIPVGETTFKITEIPTFVYEPSGTEQTVNKTHSTNEEQSSYEIEVKPNRKYSFTVAAKTCAGSSKEIQAVGECVTDSAAPDHIVQPSIINKDSNTKTQEIRIAIPDETNGQIICIFVMMSSGENTSSTVEFTQDQLDKAEEAATTDRSTEGVEYLAKAITRSNIVGTKTTVFLGDGHESECNASGQTQRVIRSSETGSYRGKNWPLTSEITYSYYIVTSTPTNTRGVQFGKSESTSFQYVFVEGSLALIVSVSVISILIVIGAIVIYIWRRQIFTTKLQAESGEHIYENPVIGSELYESAGYDNVRLKTENSNNSEIHQYSEIKDP